MGVVYFTSNASTGAGSLAEAIQNASPGDVVRPDETVFERGATIEIALAGTLNVDKNLTLDGGPFRVAVNGGSVVRCAFVASGATVEFTSFDFVGGATTSSGGGIYVDASASLVLTRCRVAGCSAGSGGGGIYSRGAVTLNDCVATGCVAGTANGGGISSTGALVLDGSTVVGNATGASGADVRATATLAASNSILGDVSTGSAVDPDYLGCVVGVASSSVGFVAPPPDVLTVEDWFANAWQNWDLRLLDDASPSPSRYRDSGNVNAASTYDLDGNFRGRELNGAPSFSPGAYETLQADLFWVGARLNSAVVGSPSFLGADGWATSRFATASGDAAPQAGQSVFVDGRVHFIDVLSTSSTQTLGLTVGGRATVSTGSSATTQLDLSLGLGATFDVSTSATLRRFGADAKINWTSGDLTVAVDVASSSLTIPPGSTLTAAGVRVAVETLRIGDAASVAFSPVRLQDAVDGTNENATTCVDAVLSATTSATVGAATFSGTGYFASPPETDLTAATFAETVRVVDYSAGVADFTATATGPTTADVVWSATDAAARVCVERENAAAPNGWETLAFATAAESPLSVALNGRKRFRIFDGQTFNVDSAYFPTGDFYVYVADDISAVATVAVEWETATQLISAGNVMYRNENVLLLASVKNKLTAVYLSRDEVEAATATVYAVSPGFGAREIWSPVDGWENIAVPLDAILEAPTEIDGWTLDEVGPNFVWTPDATTRPLFGDSGTFAVQVCVKRKSGGNPIYFTFRAVVK